MLKQWYYQNVHYAVVKNQGLLINLGIKIPLSKAPILGDILFWVQLRQVKLRWRYKINEIVNKFLLAGHRFMPEMHLKQPGFIYSAWGPFNKNKERIQKFKKTGDTNYIYKNGLDKACFWNDMVYGDFKDLARRTASDKVFRDKAFNTAKNPKYDGYQRGLALMFYKIFDKKSTGSGVNIHANNERPLGLVEELHKPIIIKFQKRTVYSRFKDNIWGADLADM